MCKRLVIIVVLIGLCNSLVYSQKLEKLPAEINTAYDEILPVLSADGSRLYFTRVGYPISSKSIVQVNRQSIREGFSQDSLLRIIYSDLANRPIQNPMGSRYNQDIWIADLDDNGNVEKVWHPESPMNNALPNAVLSVIHDTGDLILLNQYKPSDYTYEGISICNEPEEQSYSLPQALTVYDYGSEDNTINLSISHDGEIIVWSLKKEGGYGDRDLYVSFRVAYHTYTAPKNLGPDINTPFRESAPYLSRDGKTLYFSSNKPGSIGGTDIFYAVRLDYSWTNWSRIQSMKAPINSIYDDSQPMPSPDGRHLYFTSKRSGNSDIYKYTFPTEEKEIEKRPIPIHGIVVDAETDEPIAAEISWGKAGTRINKMPHYFRSTTGDFNTELMSSASYVFYADKPGYNSSIVDVHLSQYNLLKDSVIHVRIALKRKENIDDYRNQVEKQVATAILKQSEPTIIDSFYIEKSVILHNIYFKRSEAVVLRKSWPALDDLYRSLVRNPQKVILISGHTDNVGPEKLLMELSEERAKAIKAYLVKKGINPERIKTIGYGAKRPLNDNSSEKERQQNRRVEISFIK